MNREDFTMLNKDLIYFDNGATTMKPKCVINSIVEYYEDYCANSHSGDYVYSEMVSERYEAVREKIARFINARESSEIVFTSGATDGINRIVFGYFKKYLNSGDEVLLTNSEHASNTLPWFKLASEIGIKVKYIS